MNRIIKFRAWHVELKKMFSAEEMGQDQLTLSPDGRGFVNVNSVSTRLSVFAGEKMIPLQSTDRFDKKGREIWEGDIVLIKTKQYGNDGKDHWKKEIVWVKCERLGYVKAYFDLAGKEKWDNGHSYEDWDDDWEANDNIEVIGNIYESPDLLKKL